MRQTTATAPAITPKELAEFAKFAHAKLSQDLPRETPRTKPYQIYTPSGASSTTHVTSHDNGKYYISTSPSSRLRPGGSSEQQHPMHSYFVDTTPKYMRCADQLDQGSWLEKKSRALAQRYVQPNSANRVAFEIYDLDYPGAADAFEEKNVVVPNFVTVNPENGHAHYGYAMEVPISTGPNSRQGPHSFLKAVRTGMTRRLGADQNFKHGLGKNPLHPDWRTAWLTARPYSLNDMAAFLDAEEMRQTFKTKAEQTEFAQQGRNCELTSELGKYGLRTGWRMRQGGVSYDAFLGEMRAQAHGLNGLFAEQLGYREVMTVAKSVAKWAWAESTFEKFSEIQSARAKLRSIRNWAILDQIPDLSGRSSAEIAELLGRTERTARRYLAEIRAPVISTKKAAPWEPMGISRATYYRRQSETPRTKP